MPVDLSDVLVIGVSSRSLFNLEEENEIFEKEGIVGYREYQLAHENDPLEPGTAFHLRCAMSYGEIATSGVPAATG